MKPLPIIVVLLFVISCTATVDEPTVPNVPGEVAYHDVFLEPLVSTDIVVQGVKLGSTEEDILSYHGEPDVFREHNFGRIKNMEYSFGTNDTAVLYHLEEGVVTGILLTKNANEFLVGETKIEGGLNKMYGLFGTPSAQQDLSFQRVYVYDELGYEVYTRRDKFDRVYLVEPNRGISTGSKNDSLCAQVITPAVSNVTSECVEFPTPCSVPEGWTPVEACS